MTKTLTLPLIPLRGHVAFPKMTTMLFMSRELSIKALRTAKTDQTGILLFAQRDDSVESPVQDDLHLVGVKAVIQQVLTLPDRTVKVVLDVESRVKLDRVTEEDGMLMGHVTVLDDHKSVSGDVLKKALDLKAHVMKSFSGVGDRQLADENVDAGRIADLVANAVEISIDLKQALLSTVDVAERVDAISETIQKLIITRNVEMGVQKDVHKSFEKQQREAILRRQMEVIKEQLEAETEEVSDIDALAERIKKAVLSDEARQKVDSEMKRLRSIPASHPESGIVRTYIEWLLDLPWAPSQAAKPSVQEAEDILNAHHYALEDVKERVLDHIAVQSRADNIKGPILCLVGPPGVGKTSLGKSVAAATGREFIRIALGGVSDESEIRGHRRTYVGALPGKIITAMKKCKTSNPLIMLDEIDKLSNHRGDPESALLELLDPEQNKEFADTYLEVKYDFSQAMFMTTSNSYEISRPLLDRMEIIPVSGYTEEEKLHIAKTHLAPKKMAEIALAETDVILPEASLLLIIQDYTREAGVRSLERKIAAVLRKCVSEMVKNDITDPMEITPEKVRQYLGPRLFEPEMSEIDDHVGMVNGLAWSEAGGGMLHLEAITMPGKGEIKATGRLGDVMKESVQTAASFVRAISPELGISPEVFKRKDLHVHAPAGATPKDGPSAGLAIVTVIVSALTNNPVRKDVAMTGEVTIRGNALKIGGLKEKLLAALRGGIKTVLIPKGNERDLEKMPESVLEGLEIIPVSNVREVLKVALTRPLVAIDWQDLPEPAIDPCAGHTH